MMNQYLSFFKLIKFYIFLTTAEPLPKDRDPTAVYANNELDLSEISVFGFDYDYTLACYKENLPYLIYDLGKSALINAHKYPKEIEHLVYNPGFAVRGLHCDVRKGFLLKIDSFHHIQMGTVYRGKDPVEDVEVMSSYHGTHVPIDNLSGFHGTGPRMHQLMDLFALPEMALLSNVIQYFKENDIPYDPEYVFHDVRSAVQGIHANGMLHRAIMENIETYLGQQEEVGELLKSLRAAGKQMFLITNSGVPFVDRGMTHLMGTEWRDYFDVIIFNARKPKFFNDTTRPFRKFDPTTGLKSWNKINELEKGEFYQEGNFYKLITMTGWYGKRVLYFGDHVYTDLAGPTLKHGWRTGAIIPELEHEIMTQNSSTYKHTIRWLKVLEELISKKQIHIDPESQATLAIRYADLYMSSVSSLLNYSLKHTFYPRRSALPHELGDPPIAK
ncbi:hypothetical protein CAPTEDRAFT_6114 [Capitella teleta]|uniref:5'-nucleotidase domain-containing protein 3 n=1 Tax=Capitella teleta TaxID=283909 RepID=R7VF58_CAPTE|nr:hypothetical protein CAPTEDRAFT_6114 [Capitella teleta]|eukprot:ELU17493.1 hypothetical protein CAPTEDRAFT_6114 [Capitella teleta]